MDSISLEKRREILSREIANYSQHGWRVVAQTETTAQLVKQKSFSCLWATLWLLLFGVGILVYLFYYWGKKDETIFISVNEFGQVSRR